MGRRDFCKMVKRSTQASRRDKTRCRLRGGQMGDHHMRNQSSRTFRLTGMAACLLGLSYGAQAAFITGPGDPNYFTTVQGASANTFATLTGRTVGIGAGDLKVSLGTWTDPSGLVFATLTSNSNLLGGGGTTLNKLTDGYTQPSLVPNPGNARD